MAKFVFYTPEGYTVSPSGTELESFQILGFEEGYSAEAAKEALYADNDWIAEAGFDYNKILYKELK